MSSEVVTALASWEDRRGPLRRRVADCLREDIERGDLPAGSKLPPERTLALDLSVSRTTVMGAYDTLRQEGWLQSRRGSGTYVSGPKGVDGHRDRLLMHLSRNPIF